MTHTTGEGAPSAPGGPFEIEVVDVRGVPTRTWRGAQRTLLEVWRDSAASGDATYLVYEDERRTYAQVHERVAALAAAMAARWDLGQGDRVAIALRNYPEWAEAFWATISLGAVAVPLNAWWTGPELAYGLADSGSRVVLADGERLERLGPHVSDLGLAGVVAVRTPEVPAGATAFEDLVAEGRTAPAPAAAEVDPDDDVTIMYTSGTTGRPKGAAGTHRNICSFLHSGLYAAAARAVDLPAADPPAAPAPPVTLLTFPLFHVGGLQSHLIPYTAHGGTLVLLHRWDADRAVTLIERKRVTAFSGVPTTVFGLLERAADRGVDLASLTGLSSGSTLVPPELVRRVDAQFASRVAPANGYGLTETTGSVVANFGADYLARPDSVGRPIAPVNEVRVVGVVGVPHPRLGEEVAAVVRTRPGSDLDAAGVRAHVAARLAAFKVPALVELRSDELPRNATGKVLKRQLRDELVAAATDA